MPDRMAEKVGLKIIAVWCAILSTVVCCHSADPVYYNCGNQGYWSRQLISNTWIKSISLTKEGYFLCAGSEYVGTAYFNAFVLKVDPFGGTIWTKTIGQGLTHNAMNGSCLAADGNLITVGENFGIRKIDANNGAVMWERAYSVNNNNAFSIAATQDGNFIVAGIIYAQTTLNYYGNAIYLMKVNPNGDSIWTRKYFRGRDNTANAITRTSDGNCLVVGNTDSTGMGFSIVYVLKIKPDGDTAWTRTYRNGGVENNAYAVTETPEGNFIIAGEFNLQSTYLLKIDTSGDTTWTRTLSTLRSTNAKALVPTLDKNYMVVGDQELFKINPNGGITWVRNCGSGIAAVQTVQGDFCISENLGYSSSSGGLVAGWLFYLVEDKYVYKGFPFSYKIPIYEDSLSYIYTPRRTPSGMTVSRGGTISWTPTVDSFYTEHDTFFVSNQTGKKDTLALNIVVNSQNVPNKTISPSISSIYKIKANGIVITSSPSFVSFSLPVKLATLGIYDIHGRLVDKLPVSNGSTIWCGTSTLGYSVSTGRYFVKAVEGKGAIVQPFLFIRK
jgi:hypothetical protein